MFKVGQKVVCIKGYFKARPKYHETLPVKGEIYTVRDVVTLAEMPCLRLVEIVNAPQDYSSGVVECGFQASAFRTIDTAYGEQVCEELERITEQELA